MSKKTWSDAELLEAVNSSITKSEVIQKLGLKVRPGNYKTVDKYIRLLNLDTKHFLGKSHGKSIKTKVSLEEALVINSTYSRSTLKKRLIDKNLIENKCGECGLDALWNSSPLILILDHINGVNDDNRLSNLRLLCPNCNSQTKTFCRGTWAKPEPKRCKNCNIEISKKSVRCSKCDGLSKRNQHKINWPDDFNLVLDNYRKYGFAATGRLYNCSDKAVKKFLERNGLI